MLNRFSPSERDQLMAELLVEHKRRQEANKPVTARFELPTPDTLEARLAYAMHIVRYAKNGWQDMKAAVENDYRAGLLTLTQHDVICGLQRDWSADVHALYRELRDVYNFYFPVWFANYPDGMRYVLNVRDSRRPGRTGTIYLKRDTSGAWYKMLRLPESPGVLDDHGVFWPDDELLRGSGGGLQWT